MNRKIGAIFLIAATCLGSGMVALPIVLSKIGLGASLIFMFAMWGLMYRAALVTVELNLQAKKSMPLGLLGARFSGPIAQHIGTLSLKILSYALLAAFLYGATSIVHECFPTLNKSAILLLLGGGAYLVLVCQTTKIDALNRFLFFILMGGLFFLVALLLFLVDWQMLPLTPPTRPTFSMWATLLPVVFTSFGFHGMIHTITDYCHNDKAMLKKAFFWGSLIPALIYILWTFGVLGAIHGADMAFYQKLATGTVEVGDLVRELSELTQKPFLRTLIWSGLILKFILSIIGVGISLRDALSPLFSQENVLRHRSALALMVMVPPVLVAQFVPNAFITILGFAGMILAVIAIILPVYLLHHIATEKFHDATLKQAWVRYGILTVGLSVVGFEVCLLLRPYF